VAVASARPARQRIGGGHAAAEPGARLEAAGDAWRAALGAWAWQTAVGNSAAQTPGRARSCCYHTGLMGHRCGNAVASLIEPVQCSSRHRPSAAVENPSHQPVAAWPGRRARCDPGAGAACGPRAFCHLPYGHSPGRLEAQIASIYRPGPRPGQGTSVAALPHGSCVAGRRVEGPATASAERSNLAAVHARPRTL
jgi:hypothetical protein